MLAFGGLGGKAQAAWSTVPVAQRPACKAEWRPGRHLVRNDVSHILFSEEDIANRIMVLGDAITRDYADKADDGIVLVTVLRGGAIFMADLARAIRLPVEIDFMAVSSYGSGMKSSGVVRILKDLSSSIEGKHVIVVEDIIDSGLTLSYLLKNLSARNPASIEVAALLRKKTESQSDVRSIYTGFECPDEFIVGYGLDYQERYRNLPYIAVLSSEHNE
ncbi:hypoxanthine phosphoribosyltransferase [Xiamenia xianingshaonis]|uniref:Hypoxanthine phosphoribosyltransferase n=2 Tax=Xiamenia xianingshaonis TaxID=2682776 RepID=A0A9E6SU37_9ACTN|nr:hypoxanthine phosphoribosyltransferase [Xiamenia xianingshaonis]